MEGYKERSKSIIEKKRSPGRQKRTPLGTRHVDLTLSNEVVIALIKIREKSDQGESMSRFVDNCLREHPQVKVELEQAQEKGVEQHG